MVSISPHMVEVLGVSQRTTYDVTRRIAVEVLPGGRSRRPACWMHWSGPAWVEVLHPART